MTAWRNSQSSIRPEELDTTSSEYVVYERRNIESREETDPMDGETRTVWYYEERTIPKDEYAAMSSPATQLIMRELSDLQLQIASL